MVCPSEFTWAMYADNETPEHATLQLRAHLDECQNCQTLLSALEEENRALVHAFQEIDVLETSLQVPDTSGRARAVAAELAVSVLGLAVALQIAIDYALGVDLPAALDWLNPFRLSGQVNFFLNSLVFLVNEGSPMMQFMMNSVIVLGLVVFGGLAASGLFRRSIKVGSLFAAIVLVISLSSPSYALDVRRGNTVTVAAGEMIDDTLVVFARTVIVDGTVNGDVITFGERLTVNGAVEGDVISFGRTVEVRGNVNGNVYGFGQTIRFLGQSRNVYGFAESINVDATSEIGGNVTLFGSGMTVDGNVGRSLTAFGGRLEVRGNITRDVTVSSNDVTLLPPARVLGDLIATVPRKENVQVLSGATVEGKTDVRIRPARPSQYRTASFYLFQVIRVAAAFVTGLALFWLFPFLSRPALESRNALLTAGVIGLLGACSIPIAAVLIGATIVGLPIGVVTLVLWALGLYLAKIVVAAFLGRALLSSHDSSTAITLLAGLVLIILAINLPFVGTVVNILLTLLGFGTLLLMIYRVIADKGYLPELNVSR